MKNLKFRKFENFDFSRKNDFFQKSRKKIKIFDFHFFPILFRHDKNNMFCPGFFVWLDMVIYYVKEHFRRSRGPTTPQTNPRSAMNTLSCENADHVHEIMAKIPDFELSVAFWSKNAD